MSTDSENPRFAAMKARAKELKDKQMDPINSLAEKIISKIELTLFDSNYISIEGEQLEVDINKEESKVDMVKFLDVTRAIGWACGLEITGLQKLGVIGGMYSRLSFRLYLI